MYYLVYFNGSELQLEHSSELIEDVLRVRARCGVTGHDMEIRTCERGAYSSPLSPGVIVSKLKDERAR